MTLGLIIVPGGDKSMDDYDDGESDEDEGMMFE